MDGREAWHIIFLLGVWGNRISFLSQIKMMHHAGMNNFMAIDIHILTNRKKSYGHVGNGFITEKKKEWRVSFQLFEKWHIVIGKSDCWCWVKKYLVQNLWWFIYSIQQMFQVREIPRSQGNWNYPIIGPTYWNMHVHIAQKNMRRVVAYLMQY